MRALSAISSVSPRPSDPAALPHSPAPHSSPSAQVSFAEVLRRVGTEVDRGERVVHHALRANPFAGDAQGMIALQAGVYRYVEAVDLVTRLVDRATGAVRTTLQSQ